MTLKHFDENHVPREGLDPIREYCQRAHSDQLQAERETRISLFLAVLSIAAVSYALLWATAKGML
jgi:hypothetical protein